MAEDKKKGLVPNVGYDDFVLGGNVSAYLDRPHTLRHFEPTFLSDTYHFEEEGIDLWCDQNGIIYTIRCCTSCIYHGVELIGMNYDAFMKLQIDVPDNLMPLYMMEANGQGHTEEIVCCYNAGLKIWFDDETGPIVNIFIVNSFEDDIYGPEE